MRRIPLLLLFLLYFASSFGQHAENVRKVASAMLKARDQKDYEAYTTYFYPTEIKYRGGKAQWIKALKNDDRESAMIRLERRKQSLGKVSKVYKAGKELHCIIEWNLKGKNSSSHWNFLAISGDQGKSWKFIITAGKTPSEVWAMVPKFNQGLTWVDYNE